MKKIIFYLKLLFADQYKKSSIYAKYLGVKFGKNVRILHFPRWGSEPFLIEIGDNVTITRGVCFVNHDGGVAIFRNEYPGLNVFGNIKVGNNVFIGINSILLPGITIGNNVVIGAGSIINKDIPDNVVVAGVPAKVIKTIDDYRDSTLSRALILKDVTHGNRKEMILEYLKNRND